MPPTLLLQSTEMGMRRILFTTWFSQPVAALISFILVNEISSLLANRTCCSRSCSLVLSTVYKTVKIRQKSNWIKNNNTNNTIDKHFHFIYRKPIDRTPPTDRQSYTNTYSNTRPLSPAVARHSETSTNWLCKWNWMPGMKWPKIYQFNIVNKQKKKMSENTNE